MKKDNKAHLEKKKLKQEEQEKTYSPIVEKKFKLLLKIMSWVVGIAFAAVLILPEFNSPLLDKITKVLFLIGFSDLILFLIIEFLSDNVKDLLEKVVHE